MKSHLLSAHVVEGKYNLDSQPFLLLLQGKTGKKNSIQRLNRHLDNENKIIKKD